MEKCCVISIAMGVNVQVYTISNILMSIQIVSTGIDVIKLATAILTVQFCSNLNKTICETNELILKMQQRKCSKENSHVKHKDVTNTK